MNAAWLSPRPRLGRAADCPATTWRWAMPVSPAAVCDCAAETSSGWRPRTAPTPITSPSDAQADLWRQRNTLAQALPLYEEAVSRQPSVDNQLMLAICLPEGAALRTGRSAAAALRRGSPAGGRAAGAPGRHVQAAQERPTRPSAPTAHDQAASTSCADPGRHDRGTRRPGALDGRRRALDEAGPNWDRLDSCSWIRTTHRLRAAGGSLRFAAGIPEAATQAYQHGLPHRSRPRSASTCRS